MSKSTLNDSEILQKTKVIQGGSGKATLSFALPSGRVVISDPVPPEQLKGKVLIQWAHSIREQDELDIQAKENEQAATRSSRKLVESTGQRSVKPITNDSTSSSSSSTPDPQELVRVTVSELRAGLNKMLADKAVLELAIAQAKARLEKWTKIAEGLGLEVSGKTTGSDDEGIDSLRAGGTGGDGSDGPDSSLAFPVPRVPAPPVPAIFDSRRSGDNLGDVG